MFDTPINDMDVELGTKLIVLVPETVVTNCEDAKSKLLQPKEPRLDGLIIDE